MKGACTGYPGRAALFGEKDDGSQTINAYNRPQFRSAILYKDIVSFYELQGALGTLNAQRHPRPVQTPLCEITCIDSEKLLLKIIPEHYL